MGYYLCGYRDDSDRRLPVITQVDPNMVIKKNNKNDDDDEVTEVQDGWKGHILPFELVQEMLMPNEVEAIRFWKNAC